MNVTHRNERETKDEVWRYTAKHTIEKHGKTREDVMEIADKIKAFIYMPCNYVTFHIMTNNTCIKIYVSPWIASYGCNMMYSKDTFIHCINFTLFSHPAVFILFSVDKDSFYFFHIPASFSHCS